MLRLRGQSQDHAAAIGEIVERAIWSSFDIANAARFAENDFFIRDLAPA